MKNKFILCVLIGFCLGFSLPVFAAVSYSRTPSGYTISNPVIFEVSWSSIEDFLIDCPDPGENNYWGINTQHVEVPVDDFSIGIASSTLSYEFILNLPLGEYKSVKGVCSTLEDLEIGNQKEFFLEGYGSDIIFEVVEASGGGNFFTLPSDFLASTTAYIGSTFTDLWTLIALCIGLPLAFWMTLKIVNLGKKKDKSRKIYDSKEIKERVEKNNWL